MTQEVLASAAGVSSRTVIRAERGYEISAENLKAICSVLGLDAAGLLQSRAIGAVCGEGEAKSADAGAGDARTLVRGIASRLVDWRFTVAAMLALALSYPLTDYAIARVWGYYRPFDFMDRQMSTVRGTVVAARVNAVLGHLARGIPPSPADLGPNWEFMTNSCQSPTFMEGLAGRSERCSRTVGPKMVVRSLGDDGADFVIGPVDDSFLEAFALLLAAPRGITLQVASAADTGTPAAGSFWFDPRGIDPRRLPAIRPDSPYLDVRIHRTGARS